MNAYLSICAVYRDEAPYLAEWIEFHRLVGFERFYLYDNGSSDWHREVLDPYVDEGIVLVHDWPEPLLPDGQRKAYNHCFEHHGDETRWIDASRRQKSASSVGFFFLFIVASDKELEYEIDLLVQPHQRGHALTSPSSTTNTTGR